MEGIADLKEMMKGLEKQTQTHVTFDNDKIMLKKENLESAEEKNHQMHLTMKSGSEIVLKNTNFMQYKTAWDK